jgi:hypothetical protein
MAHAKRQLALVASPAQQVAHAIEDGVGSRSATVVRYSRASA